ncbi:MAG: hypothetical protein JWN15_4192 [Firmicutes bacterium]|nr:hypothetical protein [Bacillota bacterium]
MAYHSVSHVALRVAQLQAAEEFYCDLFGLAVAFREADTPAGWATLPEGAGWEDAAAAGIQLELSMLHRDGLSIALEQAGRAAAPDDALSHIGLFVAEADLAELRTRVAAPGFQLRLDRPDLLLFEDPHGITWEVSTVNRLRSSGASIGRWLDIGQSAR